MNARTLRLALALCLTTATAAAQNAAGSAAARPTTAPATAPAAPARPAAAPVQPAAAQRPRTPAPRRDAGPTDLVAAATQVLNGVVGAAQNNPRSPAPQADPPAEPSVGDVPAQVLRGVGLDPSALPGVLGPFLRSNAGRRQRLSPEQLGQLGQLARRNLNARQLESVATAFTRAAPQDDPPTLSARELTRVAQLASRGVTSTALRNAVAGMLR